MTRSIQQPETSTLAAQRSAEDVSVLKAASAGSAGPAVAAGESVADDEGEDDGLLAFIFSTTALSYYLSSLLHLLAYGVAAVAFAWIGGVLTEDEETIPIRASLDDFDRLAPQPEFEAVPDVVLGGADGESNIERISNNLRVIDDGLVESVSSDILPSAINNKNTDENSSGEGAFLFSLPESGLAVTKGSFTCWTEPESPQPLQPYLIIIEVRLKDGVRVYRVNDLSGFVIGSDNYRQKIPYDNSTPNSSFYTDENKKLQPISGSERIKVRHNKVQLAIRVPGARRLVRDRIEIRSRRLREKQELELVFGQ